MATTKKNTYHVSPFGIAGQYPWISKPDTAFNKNLFHIDVAIGGVEGAKLKETIEEAADAAFEEFKQTDEWSKLKAADKAKWGVYYPFDELDDGAGFEFKFRQNAVIKLKDGTEKELEITIVDGDNEAVTAPVFGGSEVRIMYSVRPITMASNKQVGVRLDFSKVQVKKLAKGTGGGPGFDKIESEDEASVGGEDY